MPLFDYCSMRHYKFSITIQIKTSAWPIQNFHGFSPQQVLGIRSVRRAWPHRAWTWLVLHRVVVKVWQILNMEDLVEISPSCHDCFGSRPVAVCNYAKGTTTPCCCHCIAHAWISQVAHSGEELMRVYTICYYLFYYVFFVVVVALLLLLLSSSFRLLSLLLLPASSSCGRLPFLAGKVGCLFFLAGEVDCLFWQEVGCLFGRIFSAWWWYCVHVWGLQWRSFCVLSLT